LLAERLRRYVEGTGVVVLALPRGGVPVGFEVARALGAQLDVFVVRKLGLPGHPELGMGAIASGGIRVLNQEVLQRFAVAEATIEQVTHAEEAELRRREWLYRGDRPPVQVTGRATILVDDGLATGSTMRAAVLAVERRDPSRVIIGVPVAPADSRDALAHCADEVVCAVTPEPFLAIGLWYEDFAQTTDDEVRRLLAQARVDEGPHAGAHGRADG
jgi:predicted phosphoribosyltransferase